MWDALKKIIRRQDTVTKITIVTGILLAFGLYSLVDLVYKNYKIEKQIEQFRTEILALSDDNLEQENKMLYYAI